MIKLVGFDGDDTLWHSELYYQQAHADFEAVVSKYVDLQQLNIYERLLGIERENLRLFGYGVKAMTLSMLEAAIEVTESMICADDMKTIVSIGKRVLCHPVELLPGVRDALDSIVDRFPVVLITKGDHVHQELKIKQSGLADLFGRVEIVSEKDSATYSAILSRLDVNPNNFAMVGNSLRSDIAPVISIGGSGVYIPYPVTWIHEQDAQVPESLNFVKVAYPQDIPRAIEELDRRSAS